MLSLFRKLSLAGEYESIRAAPSIHPDRADRAEKAIAQGTYEDRGARDDGVRILLTRTIPPLVVVARIVSSGGGKANLQMLHVAEVREGAAIQNVGIWQHCGG